MADNKDKLAIPNDNTQKRKIGAPALHQRVAAQPLPPQGSLAQTQSSAVSQNPFDVSMDMTNRIGLMLDCSSSMGEQEGGKEKITHLKDACLDFIANCDFTNTSIAIERFPERDYYDPYDDEHDPSDPLAHLLPGQTPLKAQPVKGLCNVPAFLTAAINQIRASGGTPLAPCLERTLLANSLTRGVIVSDGEADSPGEAIRQAAKWREAEVPIDTVHIGRSMAGENLLKQIAEMTGGIYIKFDNVANFSKAFKYLAPAFRAMLTSGGVDLLDIGAKEIK